MSEMTFEEFIAPVVDADGNIMRVPIVRLPNDSESLGEILSTSCQSTEKDYEKTVMEQFKYSKLLTAE